MFLVGLLQWWYGRGWVSQATLFKDHLADTAAFFSIGDLVATLFAPFRQVSAGQVSGPVGMQLRAFADKSISRLIGAFIRFMAIIAGIVTLTVRGVVEGAALLLWCILPALPIVGFIMFAIGWVPQWM